MANAGALAAVGASPRRLALRFSVEQLSERDELLLKSLVRVLDHRTRHHWECVTRDADLRLIAQGAGDPDGPRTIHATMRGGDSAALAPDAQLPLPLHPERLQALLDRMGDALAARRDPADDAASKLLRLRHWPPIALLGTGTRLSMATLLSRACSLQTLQRQSGASEQACTEFLNDLRHAGLLIEEAAPPPEDAWPAPPAAAPVQARAAWPAAAPSGLLSRIRSRLGLQHAQQR